MGKNQSYSIANVSTSLYRHILLNLHIFIPVFSMTITVFPPRIEFSLFGKSCTLHTSRLLFESFDTVLVAKIIVKEKTESSKKM